MPQSSTLSWPAGLLVQMLSYPAFVTRWWDLHEMLAHFAAIYEQSGPCGATEDNFTWLLPL